MKKILIPIDFKCTNHDAIDYTINFFKSEVCEFFFINTYTYNISGLDALSVLQEDDEMWDKPQLESEQNLGHLVRTYTKGHTDRRHRFNAISQYADLIEGIKKAIKEIGIDLIVLPGKENSLTSSNKYSKNTKRIIENVRECPIMIIPATAKLYTSPQFVLVSNFEEELPAAELQNWYELVAIAEGTIKIVTLSGMDKMTELQKLNQSRVRYQIEMHFNRKITSEYIETVSDLKDFANNHTEYIICLMDKKPTFWRILGIAHSQVTNLGPLQNTPLIALHS